VSELILVLKLMLIVLPLASVPWALEFRRRIYWRRFERGFGAKLSEHPLLGGIQIDRETDGEHAGDWIAEMPDMPGIMVYGNTRVEVVTKCERLACRVVAEAFLVAADRMERGELAVGALESAITSARQLIRASERGP
jgi:hypothetical protein